METTLEEKPSEEAPDQPRAVAPKVATAGKDKSEANEYKALFNRATHFMGGTVILFLIGFVSFPILARIFTVEQYGLVALVSSTVGVAVVFSKCGLQTSVQRFYKEHAVSLSPENLQRYYSTVYLTAGGLGVLVCIPFGLFLFFRYLPEQVISARVQMLLGYAAALIFLRSISSMITNLLQVEGRTTAYNVLQIFTKIATVGVTVLLLLTWHREPSVFFLGCVAVEALAVAAMVPYLRRMGMLALSAFDWRMCREALVFGFPMMGTEIFWLILDSGDRFLVAGFLGPQQLGLYAAAYNISGYIRDSLSSPLYLALFPLVMDVWVLKGKEETQKFLSRSMNFFVLTGIGIVVGVSVCANDAINIVASTKFHDASRLLPYLVLGMMISAMSMFLKCSLMIDKQTVKMLHINLAACLVNVAMNVILLPKIGILGAAIATLGSYAVMTGLMAHYAQKSLPLSMDWAAWLKYSAVGFVSWFVISQVNIDNFFLSLLFRGALSMLVYFGLLYATDRRARELLGMALRTASRFLGQQQASSEGSAE